MIFRDELNLEPAPPAPRFTASGLTFSSPQNDRYQVGIDEMNRHCRSSQVLLSIKLEKKRPDREGLSETLGSPMMEVLYKTGLLAG
jgi:hypothetical protein